MRFTPLISENTENSPKHWNRRKINDSSVLYFVRIIVFYKKFQSDKEITLHPNKSIFISDYIDFRTLALLLVIPLVLRAKNKHKNNRNLTY